MNIKFSIVIVAFLFLYNCKTEKKEPEVIVTEPAVPTIVADSIRSFYPGKRIWIALNTADQEKVAEVIGLEEFEPINWELGLKNSRRTNRIDSRVFISPVINEEWIIVTGYDLPSIVHRKFENFANELSEAFGHFSYYYAGKETFGLAKATDGNLERYIYYNNNSDVRTQGKQTQAEKDLPLLGGLIQYKYSEKLTKAYKKSPFTFKGLHDDINYSIGPDDEVYVEYTIPWPNAKYIYDIAEQWSINPSKFVEKGYTSEGLGLFGKTNYKY